MRTTKYIYEGEDCPDGTYQLGQLSKSGFGRVHKPDSEELFEDMKVTMDEATFSSLFKYIKTRECPISDFNAVVKSNEIIHVY